MCWDIANDGIVGVIRLVMITILIIISANDMVTIHHSTIIWVAVDAVVVEQLCIFYKIR